MATNNVLLVLNSNVLAVKGLKNAATDTFINDATVVATLEDLQGNEIAGETWPVTLTYQAESDGCYQVILPAALQIENNKQYKLIWAAQGAGLDGRWEQLIKAENRH